MNALDQFSIPYKGLGIGVHELSFEIDDSFFKAFDAPIVDNGHFSAKLELDKRSDHGILTFEVDGYTNTYCDRCLAEIKLPVSGTYRLHFKFAENMFEEDEIVFLHPETSIVNVGKYFYDVIGISMPMTKIYDCESDPEANCNEAVLARLATDEEIEKQSDELPSPWDGLKGLSFEE